MNWKTVSINILSMILIFPAVAYGQNEGWVDDGSVVRLYTSADNVGIGTPSPDSGFKLHVNGFFKATGFKTLKAPGTSTVSVVGGYNTSLGVYVDYATISGGKDHYIGSDYSTVGGGVNNDIHGYAGAICGGKDGYICSYSSYAFIGGGLNNRFDGNGDYGVIGGGKDNELTVSSSDNAFHSVIGGGRGNQISGSSADNAVIGGGLSNEATADYATVCGGYSNVASGKGSMVSGYNSNATGEYSTAIGTSVAATGRGSTTIGYLSSATADYSTALGTLAFANDANSFVWSDGTSFCYSGTTYQFKVCASNGAYFSEEVSALCLDDRPGDCSKSMGSFPDLETAYDAVMSTNPSPEDPSQLDYENLAPFISSEGPEGEINRNLSATITAQKVVIKDLIARIDRLEQAAARGQ